MKPTIRLEAPQQTISRGDRIADIIGKIAKASHDPLKSIGKKQRVRERRAVKEWILKSAAEVQAGRVPVPMATLIPITPERIAAYYREIQTGK